MASFGPSALMASDETTVHMVFGIIGKVTAVALYFSAAPTLYTIWNKRSVEQYPAFPYLAAILNCAIWMLYGMPSVHPRSKLVMSINGFGLAIELICVGIFLYFAVGERRNMVCCLLAAEVIFVGGVAALVFPLAHKPEIRSLVFGILGIITGTLMYGAPLLQIISVFQTKSVEYLSLPLSVASFLNASMWTVYALVGFDLCPLITSALGVVCAVVQLAVYARFRNRNAAGAAGP